MSLRDTYAVETDYLNKAFGWEGKEHVEQQDMTEAMKIIFDTMERALFATPYESVMKNLFKYVIFLMKRKHRQIQSVPSMYGTFGKR